MTPWANAREFSATAEFDTNQIILNDQQPFSSKEVKEVHRQWTTEVYSDSDIMEVDQEIGSDFLSDDIFGGLCPTGILLSEESYCRPYPPSSPLTPFEEFKSTCTDGEASSSSSSCGSVEEDEEEAEKIDHKKYMRAFLKLSESMCRSQETRGALTMISPNTDFNEERRKAIREVVERVKKSQRQLQSCFQPLTSSTTAPPSTYPTE